MYDLSRCSSDSAYRVLYLLDSFISTIIAFGVRRGDEGGLAIETH
jgi:hypothetical protein